MSADSYNVIGRPQLQAIADRIALVGAPQAPLYAAAAAGKIGLVVIGSHDATWPVETLARVRRPTVVLLSGDPGWGQATFGPTRWKCAKSLKVWASAAIVHGAAGEQRQYAEAAVLTEMFWRLAFIETSSSLARCWSEFFSPLPRMGYLPAKGAHPVCPAVRH